MSDKINIDDLTYGQLKQIAAQFGRYGEKVASTTCANPLPVIVRSYGAGVFFGFLLRREGQEVTLQNCRRVWSWKGAKTLSELANHGPGKGSNIAEVTALHEILEVIEIIPASPEAVKAFEAASWGG
jgi:hypothetical protein